MFSVVGMIVRRMVMQMRIVRKDGEFNNVCCSRGGGNGTCWKIKTSKHTGEAPIVGYVQEEDIAY